MRMVKTPLFSRKIDSNDNETILFELREILTNYRKALITRLILDLPTYVNYRFQVKADKEQLENMQERLFELKNGNIDLNEFGSIVKHVLETEYTYISTAPFYHEIDRNLSIFMKNVKMEII